MDIFFTSFIHKKTSQNYFSYCLFHKLKRDTIELFESKSQFIKKISNGFVTPPPPLVEFVTNVYSTANILSNGYW